MPTTRRIMMANERIAFRLAAAACAILCSLRAAQAADDFYKGKQIRLIVSTGPGGVYDTYARLIARHLPAHLPGRPQIVVQNLPGASGLKATNFLSSSAPRDGTVIAGVHNG